MELRVGGFMDMSTVDYPGKPASVIFLHGCNLRCPFCFNPELVLGKNFKTMETQTVTDVILNNRELIDGVVISGGEPTVQSDALVELCNKLKGLGLLVKIDTNGTHPEVIDRLIKEKTIDYVAMDIKSDIEGYAAASGVEGTIDNVKKSIELIKSSGLPHEFRTTVVPKLHDSSRISKMVELTNGSKHMLQQFRNEKTLEPSYSSEKSFNLDEMQKIADNNKIELRK